MPFCNQCGSEYRVGEDSCVKCGSALPGLPLPPQSVNEEVPAAPRWARATAGLIDIGVAYGLAFLLVSLWEEILVLRFMRSGMIVAIPLVYLLLRDTMGGKSIGKLILGLIVYDEKAKKPAGVADSIIRNWVLAIPLLGPTVFALVIGAQILGGKRTRFGESGAGTVVITDLEFLRRR